MGPRTGSGAELPPVEAEFSISGPFDPLAASRLRVRLEELPPGSRVVVDFAHASEVSDLGLAVLASTLAARPSPAVVLRGLALRQERLLRYLGIDASPGEPRA
jgi:hypothetical protein